VLWLNSNCTFFLWYFISCVAIGVEIKLALGVWCPRWPPNTNRGGRGPRRCGVHMSGRTKKQGRSPPYFNILLGRDRYRLVILTSPSSIARSVHRFLFNSTTRRRNMNQAPSKWGCSHAQLPAVLQVEAHPRVHLGGVLPAVALIVAVDGPARCTLAIQSADLNTTTGPTPPCPDPSARRSR
jgi:hypothetical protein